MLYAWGDAAPRTDAEIRVSFGSIECCHPNDADGFRYTAPVGAFPLGQSRFGALDMTGNVWEWVADGFAADFYQRSPVVNPRNDEPTGRKVIRGGGWGNNPWGLRATLRHANPADIGLSMVGIRCAK